MIRFHVTVFLVKNMRVHFLKAAIINAFAMNNGSSGCMKGMAHNDKHIEIY